MIDIGIGIFTGMLLLMAMITYLWFTRDEPYEPEFEPGEHPYPFLPDFPEPDPAGLFAWVNPSRQELATTAELRALAYAGDMETINSEVAAWKALMRLDEWIPSQ